MQICSKPEIKIYLVGKCPVGISPKLGKSQMGMAVGKCPVGISPVGIAPDTLSTAAVLGRVQVLFSKTKFVIILLRIVSRELED